MRKFSNTWPGTRNISKDINGSKSGFGGLEVASWPLVPKFVGSNPTEAAGSFRAKKILSMSSFGGSKAVCPMSQIYGM